MNRPTLMHEEPIFFNFFLKTPLRDSVASGNICAVRYAVYR